MSVVTTPSPCALRLLVVDDDSTEFPLLEAGFAAHACPVSLINITIAHLALVEFALSESGERAQLALVDINMPAIDGFSLAREFVGSGLPTILMSSQVDADRCLRAGEMGALALLEKPADFEGYASFAGRVLHLAGRV